MAAAGDEAYPGGMKVNELGQSGSTLVKIRERRCERVR
jgi:hypothetical protein